MPRKHRNSQDYEDEKQAAASRIAKIRGSLRAAKDNSEFQNFLKDVVNINPNAVNEGQQFWNDVRDKVLATVIPEPSSGTSIERWLTENRAKINIVYRDSKGHFTKEVTEKPVVSYRSIETGKFMKKPD